MSPDSQFSSAPPSRAFAGLRALRGALGNSTLLAHADFRRLWGATALTSFGGQISLLAIPLTAITHLHASAGQMGSLVALETAPFALCSLHAGVLVDRTRKLPILLASQILIGLTLAIVPLLAWFGVLSMAVMYVVAFLLGISFVVTGTASQVFLTHVVGRAHLVDAMSKFTATDSTAKLIGPGLAGMFIHAIGAPFAIVLDALSFFVAWVVLRRIEHQEPPKAVVPGATIRREIIEGWQVVRRNPTLWSMALGAAGWQVLFQGYQALVMLFSSQDLGLSAGAIGGAHMIGGIGALAAAMSSQRLTKKFGFGPPILMGIGITSAAWLLLASAPGGRAYAFETLSAALLLLDFGVTMYLINYISLRQAITPDALLGRMTATMRFITVAPAPLGALCAGAIAEWLGLRVALAGCGVMCAGLFVALWCKSPVRALRSISPPRVAV